MNQKTIAIAVVLMAAVLAGLFAPSPSAYAEDIDKDNHDDDRDKDNHDDDRDKDNHDDDRDKDKGGDESETSTDQEIKQKNTGSGDSHNFNCGQNLIKAGVGEQPCGQEEEEVMLPG